VSHRAEPDCSSSSGRRLSSSPSRLRPSSPRVTQRRAAAGRACSRHYRQRACDVAI
jgi:hypothetical protein